VLDAAGSGGANWLERSYACVGASPCSSEPAGAPGAGGKRVKYSRKLAGGGRPRECLRAVVQRHCILHLTHHHIHSTCKMLYENKPIYIYMLTQSLSRRSTCWRAPLLRIRLVSTRSATPPPHHHHSGITTPHGNHFPSATALPPKASQPQSTRVPCSSLPSAFCPRRQKRRHRPTAAPPTTAFASGSHPLAALCAYFLTHTHTQHTAHNARSHAYAHDHENRPRALC